MCGIFGAINLNRQPAKNLQDLVMNGTKLLKHRGPDEEGIDVYAQVCFGHARLSIIDLEGGRQPMWDCKRRGLITYNGEVYNFINIKRQLEGLGYKFHSRSDTEAVLNAYLEWGSDCLKLFRGMFAFAAFDIKKEKVILVRDRLGKKPLFYTIKNKILYFSSEIEPLYKTLGPFKLEMKSLDDYLSWQYIHAPYTIYKDVFSLPPAHFIEIDLKSGDIDKKCYWQLKFQEDRSLSIDDWEYMLDEKLKEAIRLRLISDVPFGVFLSGGIDSSLVTAYMSEILEQPIKTFSIGFNESDFSELQYAEAVATINKTEHYTEMVDVDSLGVLPLLVEHFGQPFADSSSIPTYYVSRMARKYVKMVLSGDGGDENFAGYNSYEYVIRGIEGNFSGQDATLSFRQRLLRLGYYYYSWFKRLSTVAKPSDHAYQLHCHTAVHFSPIDRRKLFKNKFKDIVKEINPERKTLIDIDNQPIISRLQYLDIMNYLPYDILTKVDIASMANSLEVRVPFLDHELVELAARIPHEFKLKEERVNRGILYDKKFILKKVAKRHYPANIIDRRKMGFGVPLGAWFVNLKDDIKSRLQDSQYLPYFFDKREIKKIIKAHSIGHDYSAKLWNLLFLEEWLRSHKESIP